MHSALSREEFLRKKFKSSEAEKMNLTRKPVYVPLFNLTNVRMFSEMKKVWRFTKEKHTRLFHLLKRCECRLLTLLLRFLQSRKVEESYLATTVVEICLLHTFARRNQWKLSNVTCVRKCSTVMMCLTATKQLGARSNLSARFAMWTVLIWMEDGSMSLKCIQIRSSAWPTKHMWISMYHHDRKSDL